MMAAAPPRAPEWLALCEIARMLRVGIETVRRWTRSGKLRSYWIVGVKRVRREDLERFIEDGQVTADSETES